MVYILCEFEQTFKIKKKNERKEFNGQLYVDRCEGQLNIKMKLQDKILHNQKKKNLEKQNKTNDE